MRVFDTIKTRQADYARKRNVKREVNNYRKLQGKESDKRVKSLIREAEEYKALFKNEGYKHYMKFIDSLRESLNYQLTRVSKGNDISEVGLASARIMAKLELLDNLQKYPEIIVKKAEQAESNLSA